MSFSAKLSETSFGQAAMISASEGVGKRCEGITTYDVA